MSSFSQRLSPWMKRRLISTSKVSRSSTTTAAATRELPVSWGGGPGDDVRRRQYHDDTLAWARRNPQLAQECLQPPPPTLDHCNEMLSSYKTESIQGYLQWRKWNHASTSSEDPFLHSKAIALSSHVLSAPLTLAMFYLDVTKNQQQKGILPHANWCCVGARTEATLPPDYWKEFLLLCSTEKDKATGETNNNNDNNPPTPVHVSLDFVGPDIHIKTPDRTVALEKQNGSSLSLKWSHQGLLHETTETWNAHILFNPGLGHDHLRQGWEPTLERLLLKEEARVPMLLTAHSEKDAERDTRVLTAFGVDVNYEKNPFASHITYEDPFDKEHLVRPNAYVLHIIP